MAALSEVAKAYAKAEKLVPGDWTPMIAVGKGVGAGIRGGTLHAVAGSLFAQIERERLDGPRWSLALREGRRLRERWAEGTHRADADAGDGWPWAHSAERSGGIPVGWWGRPFHDRGDGL